MAGLQDISPIVSLRWVSSKVCAPARAEEAVASQPAWPPPITMTSNVLMGTPIPARRVMRQGNNVSRETTSLADAEIAENHVQQFVQIHAPGDSPDGLQCPADMFGRQFRFRGLGNRGEAFCRFFHRTTVARPGEHRRFAALN